MEIGVVWVAIIIVLSIIASIGFLKFVEMPARRVIRGRQPMRFT
jgi:peptidoglycan/LPS O-acetylase OafA/YrhL